MENIDTGHRRYGDRYGAFGRWFGLTFPPSQCSRSSERIHRVTRMRPNTGQLAEPTHRFFAHRPRGEACLRRHDTTPINLGNRLGILTTEQAK